MTTEPATRDGAELTEAKILAMIALRDEEAEGQSRVDLALEVAKDVQNELIRRLASRPQPAEDAEVEALANDCAHKVSSSAGTKVWSFDIHNLHEFARRLRPVVPVVIDDAMKNRAAIAISEVRQGNGKAFRRFMPEAEAALTAALSPEN
jgi:hypothetical protein